MELNNKSFYPPKTASDFHNMYNYINKHNDSYTEERLKEDLIGYRLSGYLTAHDDNIIVTGELIGLDFLVMNTELALKVRVKDKYEDIQNDEDYDGDISTGTHLFTMDRVTKVHNY